MKDFFYNSSAEQFIEIFDYVEVHREEAIITRAGHEPAVVLPLSEYESLRETMYLMSSPANARRLMDLIAHLEQHIHKTRAVSLSEVFEPLLDKETAPEMGDNSMYMSLLNVTPVALLDFDRWGSP